MNKNGKADYFLDNFVNFSKSNTVSSSSNDFCQNVICMLLKDILGAYWVPSKSKYDTDSS